MRGLETMVDHVEHWARVRPDALSQRFLDIEGQELERYSFAEFAERTREAAAFLHNEAGLRAGDRVLLVYPPGLAQNVAFFACARLGVIPAPVAAPTPIALEAGIAKIALVARDSGARAILSTAAMHQAAQMIAAGRTAGAAALASLPWIATDASVGYAGPRVRDTPAPTLFLQYTSGSTGDPRGVVVSHENVIRNGHATLDRPHVAVSWLPQHHDMGFIGYYLYFIVTGGETHGFSPADFLQRPSLWLQTMSRAGGTHTSGPNFAYEYCLRLDKLPESELAGVDLSHVTYMAMAAEPVRASTMDRFRERFAAYGLRPSALVAGYGLAEYTLSVTFGGRQIVAANKQRLQAGELRFERPAAAHNNNQVRLVSCGRPVPETTIRIVEPGTARALEEAQIGEVWLDGSGKGGGYWQRAEQSEAVFHAAIAGEAGGYLRTGDLGFLHEGELYICGRLKDLIILRGVNFYPHDIEALVEATSTEVRTGCVAAFSTDDLGDGAETLVIVAELRDPAVLPDAGAIARALRTRLFVDAATIAFVPARTIPKTTSGKISRHRTRALWASGAMRVLARHAPGERREGPTTAAGRFAYLGELYGLRGDEDCPLVDVGLDSIVLVQLIADIKAMLAEHGAGHLVDAVDTRLLQRLRVAELFALVARFAADPAATLDALTGTLAEIRREHDDHEATLMRADLALEVTTEAGATEARADALDNALLTGATGFLGPFLLRALLARGRGPVRLLVRAAAPDHGMDRVVAGLKRARIWTPELAAALHERAEIVCGDLARPRLGLSPTAWDRLSDETGSIVHNGALVNYVMSYDALRAANVAGTRSLLALAAQRRRATFHLVSSTFIFGWTVAAVVGEDDRNPAMEHLDFGYSQSKWVAEQQTYAAGRQGLDVRVFRPSLIAPTAAGFGSREDVALRLLAFMIDHGVAASTRNQVSLLPADLVAEHIIALAAAPGRSGDTYHITADRYYTLADITRRMTALYGYDFEYRDIPAFIAEMNDRCRPRDVLFPLVDFFNRSHRKFSAMQDKRYDNLRYRQAREVLGRAGEEPDLDATVHNLVGFMRSAGMIGR